MLSTARRRELGAFYTPPDVARRLVDVAVHGLDGPLRICDPACGNGVFLLAAAEALARRGIDKTTIARHLMWGCDVDADAVDAARSAIEQWSGVSPGEHLRVAVGLDDLGWAGHFDVVVGNPPFLNQLERATTRTSAARWAVGPYTDTAFLFLLAGVELVRDGGHVLLVQPQSLVGARDAGPVRAAVAIAGMWTCDERLFEASVRVCAPLIVRGAAPAQVARWTGRDVAPIAPIDADPAWRSYLATNSPRVRLDARGALRDIATATAGFRQQFYGLAPHVVDAADGDDLPKLVTCGLIDVAHCAWGERATRFAGRRWLHPRVDIERVDDRALRRWLDDRLVPKVLLATQTKVLEPVIDLDGGFVPSTPVIAVHTDQLLEVAAVLLAPPISAWALATYAGVALASDAIKLSARQVLDLPLPADKRAWRSATAALQAGDVLATARHMTAAYGGDDAVFEWWVNRSRVG